MAKKLIVRRVDFTGKVLGSVVKTDEGYLKGEVPIAKVGIMTYYLKDGKTRNELVTEDSLFHEDSMNTLKMQPITNQHPPEILLDSRTVKRRKIGMTGENVKRQGEYLIVPIAITDSDAVKEAENGRQQFSPGYVCELLMESGTFQGRHYDAVQISRNYNHVALCDKARGGDDLKMQLDSIEHCDGFEIDEMTVPKNLINKQISIQPKRKELSMPHFRIDNIDYEADQEVVNHANKLAAEVMSVTTKLDEVTKKLDAIQTEKDELTKKIDSHEKELPTLIQAGVKGRLHVEKVADAILDEKEIKEIDKMDTLEIKKAVIAKQAPSINLDDKSPIYIDAQFDLIAGSLTEESRVKMDTQRAKAFVRKDATASNIDKEKQARADMINDLEKGYTLDPMNPAASKQK